MKILPTLSLAVYLASVALSEPTFHTPLKDPTIKRQFFSCQETYGGGSTTCGDPATSHFCYDPTLGQTCCLSDNGYCQPGDFCAPIAGFCCHNGDDPATCVSRITPALSSSTSASSSTLSLETISDRSTADGATTTVLGAVTETSFPSSRVLGLGMVLNGGGAVSSAVLLSTGVSSTRTADATARATGGGGLIKSTTSTAGSRPTGKGNTVPLVQVTSAAGKVKVIWVGEIVLVGAMGLVVMI